MRYDFKNYLPKNYDPLSSAILKEKAFPDVRTFQEYRYWKADNQRLYFEKQIIIEREKMKDREYILEQQCKRGLQEIENKIADEPYDERIDRILSGKANGDRS